MRSLNLRRLGLLVGLGVTCGVAACGSGDEKKKSRPSYNDDAGEAGAVSGGGNAGGEGHGGDPGSPGGVSGTGSNVAGEAGSTPVNEGGAAGADASGGAAGSGPRECPVGTADCDDDHQDCETSTAGDPQNCGRCERACGATAACTSGLCGATVLLDPAGDSNWCDAVFSATTAYMLTCWSSFTEVRAAPLEPGASVLGTQIVNYNVPVAYARGMLIDGNDVLFGLQGSPSYLYRFPLNANGPEDVFVAYTFEDGTRFDGIQLVGGDTFYWNHNTYTAANQVVPGFIKSRKKAAVTSTTLVTGLGVNYDLQVFGSKLVWLEKRTDTAVLGVYRSPLAGATLVNVEFVAEVGSGSNLIRRGNYAYWTDKVASPNGRVRRLLADDPEAEPEDIATDLSLPEGIAADDAYVYFKQMDALYRVPLAGGAAPEQLSPVVPANDYQATQVYLADDKYVYFAAGINGGNSTLVRVAK